MGERTQAFFRPELCPSRAGCPGTSHSSHAPASPRLLTCVLLINQLVSLSLFKSAQLRVLIFMLTLKLEKPCLSLSSQVSTGYLPPYLLRPLLLLILYLPSFCSVPGPMLGADDIIHMDRGPGPLQAILSDIHKCFLTRQGSERIPEWSTALPWHLHLADVYPAWTVKRTDELCDFVQVD